MKARSTPISIGFILLLAGLIGTSPASADPKIGVVDMRQLMLKSPDLKTAMEALKAEFEPRRQEMLKMQAAAKSNPDDENLQREFNRQAIEFQNRAYSARSEATQKVERSIIEAIRKYAAAEHFDIVGSPEPILITPPFGFFSKTADITDRVQAFILNPSVSPSASSANIPEPVAMTIGVVTGLNGPTAQGGTVKSDIRHFAGEHGIAVVFDTIYYTKPQFTITDFTAEIHPYLQPR